MPTFVSALVFFINATPFMATGNLAGMDEKPNPYQAPQLEESTRLGAGIGAKKAIDFAGASVGVFTLAAFASLICTGVGVLVNRLMIS